MAIAFASLTSLFLPLHSFVEWLGGGAPAPRHVFQPAAVPAPVAASPAVAPRRAPAVRVVRVIEPSQAPARAGRMVISGRFADVCAELDRMAALEARREAARA